jgi:mono/diheme cytochrome c family protein
MFIPQRSHWLLLGLAAALFARGVPLANAAEVQFNRDIRPILSENCFQCHGPDAKHREGDLRLDQRESAIGKREHGAAISPGNIAASELVKRIISTDEDEKMPPAKSGRQLTVEQIALLRQWIEQGAKYEEHWSLIPPLHAALPEVKDRTWPKNAIDHFVLSQLEREGMQPAPEATKSTWLRRVTFDLTGLPPTIAELETFLADGSSSAYEKVVDRLLASERYGERMAMHWLDLARYADTNGYNNDEERTQWPWRDWVIDAFNQNLPYDQFVTEQLAGDLLPNASLSQRIATAFNRNHVFTTEGGIIEEEYRVEYVADRVHTTSTVFLGLSLQCARCHDHKFDPLSQRDYYRFFAFFNNLNERTVGYNQARV